MQLLSKHHVRSKVEGRGPAAHAQFKLRGDCRGDLADGRQEASAEAECQNLPLRRTPKAAGVEQMGQAHIPDDLFLTTLGSYPDSAFAMAPAWPCAYRPYQALSAPGCLHLSPASCPAGNYLPPGARTHAPGGVA